MSHENPSEYTSAHDIAKQELGNWVYYPETYISTLLPQFMRQQWCWNQDQVAAFYIEYGLIFNSFRTIKTMTEIAESELYNLSLKMVQNDDHPIIYRSISMGTITPILARIQHRKGTITSKVINGKLCFKKVINGKRRKKRKPSEVKTEGYIPGLT